MIQRHDCEVERSKVGLCKCGHFFLRMSRRKNFWTESLLFFKRRSRNQVHHCHTKSLLIHASSSPCQWKQFNLFSLMVELAKLATQTIPPFKYPSYYLTIYFAHTMNCIVFLILLVWCRVR